MGFPSTKEANIEESTTCEGEPSEEVEHGSFPSTKAANGVETIEPIPMCLNDEMVPILCEHESHLAHFSESTREFSTSTICEIE